jgi:SAM-dependent methyltransferase
MNDSPYRFKPDPHSSHVAILRRLGAGGGRSALDVGAADGFLAERLTAQGWRVTGLEADPAQAARARERCERVIVADLEHGEVDLGGVFDAIVLGDVLEHVSDPAAVLGHLCRGLSADGLVVISVPNVAHLWVRLNLLVGRWEYQDRGILDRTHLRFFTRRSLLHLLRGTGLVVERLTVTPVPLPLVVPARAHGRWLDRVHAVSALLARCWPGGLAYQFVAFCRPGATAPGRAEGRVARAEIR